MEALFLAACTVPASSVGFMRSRRKGSASPDGGDDEDDMELGRRARLGLFKARPDETGAVRACHLGQGLGAGDHWRICEQACCLLRALSDFGVSAYRRQYLRPRPVGPERPSDGRVEAGAVVRGRPLLAVVLCTGYTVLYLAVRCSAGRPLNVHHTSSINAQKFIWNKCQGQVWTLCRSLLCQRACGS